MRWAAECREQPRGPGQLVFGIVQGGANAALREECAKALIAMDFDGYAIGGVSVGEPEPGRGSEHAACMTPASVSVFPSPPTDPVSDHDLDAFFKKPAPISNYNYADTPDPCAGK